MEDRPLVDGPPFSCEGYTRLAALIRYSRSMGGIMSHCPRCGAEVVDSDAFCSSCGASLQREPRPSPAKPKQSRGIGCFSLLLIAGGVVAVIAIIGSIWGGGSGGSAGSGPTSSAMERANIEVNCEGLVKKHLVSPGTMKVPSNDGARQLSDGSWTYDFAVDSENGFGALLRSNWHCEVHGNQVTVHQTN